MKNNDNTDLMILSEIRFGFLHTYRVAGMGEPWSMKIDKTLQLLRDQGIGAILTLTEDDLYGKRYQDAGFLHFHEPIDDARAPTMEGMDRSIEFINSSLQKDMGVVVHCVEGRGRTGIVLCAWLGLTEGLGPKGAILRVFELRSHTVLSPVQRSFIYQYLDNRHS